MKELNQNFHVDLLQHDLMGIHIQQNEPYNGKTYPTRIRYNLYSSI